MWKEIMAFFEISLKFPSIKLLDYNKDAPRQTQAARGAFEHQAGVNPSLV
ncbi:MAG: hypothetical protein HXX20_16730 [Chloroflexi bacterium]|nr:hypothetical protein [Chloroflexota bacterium]